MTTGSLHVGGLSFELRQSGRRRTLEVSIGRKSELLVYAPLSMSQDQVSKCVQKKLLWVHQKLLIKEKSGALVTEPEFVTGESFSYLGRLYQLRVVPAGQQREMLKYTGWKFLLREDARPRAKEHFRTWYRYQGQVWLSDRVDRLACRVGAKPTKVTIRDLSYRWGSCSKNRTLSFHWKLLQLPVRLIDYVIVHELTHLVQPHHGPAFWSSVERSLPDWQKRKHDLDGLAAKHTPYIR